MPYTLMTSGMKDSDVDAVYGAYFQDKPTSIDRRRRAAGYSWGSSNTSASCGTESCVSASTKRLINGRIGACISYGGKKTETFNLKSN